jgi:hypothetical protein
MFLNNFVSSAYIASEEYWDIASGRSFMKKAKSIRPKILPCGTPEITGTQLGWDTFNNNSLGTSETS